MEHCQLKSLECAEKLSFWQRAPRLAVNSAFREFQRIRRTLAQVGFLHKAYIGLRDGFKRSHSEQKPIDRTRRPGSLSPTLHLQPGEKVRIKTIEEIQQTLDKSGKFAGLAFTPAQKKYCGGEYVVLKRLERAFNEGTWKMFKMRDTVLLDDVVCDGRGGIGCDWDGCDRHCLLWWKEIWLERVPDHK
ncbi:MAG TPA: hypothetical protein PK843_03810 [bacterium]|nr:hypothetical protein [bacterium]